MVVGDRTDALELIANSASVSLVGQPGLDAGHSAPRLGVVHLGVGEGADDIYIMMKCLCVCNEK